MTTKNWRYLAVAWTIALVSTLGALFAGEVLGQEPCVLCWYQRIAMFPLAWILGIAAFRNSGDYVWYALPLAAVGAIVAAFHTLTYFGLLPGHPRQCGIGPSCTGSEMLLMGVPLPLLALLSFVSIAGLLTISRGRSI